MTDSYSSWVKYCREHKCIFPLVVDTEFTNMNRIHPLKQNDINKIYKALNGFSINLFVFGSSTSMRCNIYSDLDLAVKAHNEEEYSIVYNIVSDLCSGSFDMIDLNSISCSDPLYADIWKDGVKLL